MIFFALLAAIALGHFYPLAQRQPDLAIRTVNYLAHHVNAGKSQHGALAWLIIVVPLLAATGLIYFVLSGISLWLAWLWNVAALYLSMQFKAGFLAAEHVHQSLLHNDLSAAQHSFVRWRGAETASTDAGELSRLNIEAVFTDALQHLFGVIFWFVVLSPFGPVGAVAYRTTEVLAQHWRISTHGAFASFAQRMDVLANWLPARAAALSFAIAGNFEDALFCWRSQASLWADPNQGVLLASAAGALGVKLGMPIHQGADWRPELGLGDPADNSYLGSSLGLIWRAMAIWLFLFLLMALARLAS